MNAQSSKITSIPVLISGGGITGLILALSLAKNGVLVQVIEKQKRTGGRRGLGIHGRSLEFEKILGVLPDVMKEARLVCPNAVYDPEDPYKVVKTFSMLDTLEDTDSKLHINTYGLSQDLHESIIIEHLIKLGVPVNMETELVGFEQVSDHVLCRIRNASGEILETKAQYLIGADGAHSHVRKTLGMSFAGKQSDAPLFVLADVRIQSTLDKNFIHIWGDIKSKGYMLFPPDQNSDCWTMAATGSELDYVSVSASRETLVKDFGAFTKRPDVEIIAVQRLVGYQPHMRLVETMRSERILLAGDAAHIHSATGGQGLNSGIQDAMNLGWKLSLVVKGLATPKLLDSYSSERLPVLAMMLEITTALHGKTVKSEAGDYSALHREFALRQFGVNYRQSEIVLDMIDPPTHEYDPYRSGHDEMARAGDRAPDAAELDDGKSVKTMYDLFDNGYHTVLVFPSSAASAKPFVDYFKTCKKGLFKVIVVLPAAEKIDEATGGAIVVDRNNHARTNYRIGSDDTVAVLVRPDTFIGARVRDLEGVKRYISLFTGDV